MCERLLSLESLEVSDCDSLEEIFNLQGIIPEEGNSLAATTQPRELSFSNLQNLSVTSCESLKNLFANEGVSAQEVPVRFCFPKLTSLELLWLPKLRNFYPGKHKVKCPVLKKLKLSGLGTDEECQMQQSLLLKEISTSDHHASSSDLNRAIQQFHEKEISTSDDDASSSDDVE
ncbi:hypothetical protein JRO89_XS03G0316200 [Xanthoceras sorbifolium]|uniref:Uncharacterized protein n=1 Tax=Xanthoceras sorbifolium TaxID=99658 RepID=A0ABQ8ID40_9ROSI|nr:hypothetical protein JRO89_XS03G0316200 [Xanthoceras sorbifolium]